MLGRREEFKTYQVIKTDRTELALGDPHHRLNVPEPSRRSFDIGFQAVFSMIEFSMAFGLFVRFGAVELFLGPDSFGIR